MAPSSKTVTRRTGWVTAEHFYWHDTQNWAGFLEPSMVVQPGQHFENPETKRRMQAMVEVTGLAPLLVPFRPEPVEDAALTVIHPQSYLEHLKAVCASGGGDAGQLTPVGPASYQIAQLAVGGVLQAVDAVFTGEVDNAYVLCRPPGHHAMPDLAMGFCLFANAALGIKHAQATYGIERIATVDWDVHHGNGTQAIFYDDPSVLTISLHQDNLFPPDSGAIDETGSGAGAGVNLNIPLPPGSGSGAYREAFEKIVLPALEAFKPQAIFVPSGFDASALDPLGIMMLSSEDYRWMMRQVLAVADKHCEGRVIVTHEGGYSATYVPYCGLAVVEEMCGVSETLTDPFHIHVANYGGQALSPDQARAVEAARAAYFDG
ncbi:class II histone deacetylase [Pseudodonghicola flavimaris]|uniref:Class II histone deacetylase n=1 Tax=Pseudodonghicola flavimaris TaxID=3050036 RepID=A0ABT7F2R9_9RHOB|nr:class II histone deacetylase [Pseudodonghicola flavimaris]MDK3018888.1 class II histone deacetylase [Pseudodonghicola flavimaris]